MTLALLAACHPVAFAGVQTIAQPLARLQYNGFGDVTYLMGAQKWGASGCPNATYVQGASSLSASARKSMLAVALAAQATGRAVRFFGDCDANPDFFNAIEISIESGS